MYVEIAHPFYLESLVGAHNGTLVDKEFLVNEKTDSQMMFEKMETDGIHPVLDSLDPDSAYAVSIYKKNSQIITLARNTKRTLFVAFNKKRDVLYWSSEFDMLKFALERSNQEYEIVYLEPYHVYDISIDEIKARNETPWDVTKLEDKSKKSKPVVSSFSQGYDDIDWLRDQNTTNVTVTSGVVGSNDDLWFDYRCECCDKKLGFKEAMKRRVETSHPKGGLEVHYVCSRPICQTTIKRNLDEKMKSRDKKGEKIASSN